jgi:hypothetical protein
MFKIYKIFIKNKTKLRQKTDYKIQTKEQNKKNQESLVTLTSAPYSLPPARPMLISFYVIVKAILKLQVRNYLNF